MRKNITTEKLVEKLNGLDYENLYDLYRKAGERLKTISYQIKCTQVENVVALCNDLRYLDHEEFWVIFLRNDFTVISVEEMFSGNTKEVYVHPQEIFKYALEKNASMIILVHNHVNESLDISKQDWDVFGHMISAGNLLDIDVIDHIILTKTDFVSLSLQDCFSQFHEYIIKALEIPKELIL